MKTFLNRNSWLFSLSVILAAASTPSFAQNDVSVQTEDKVTTIQITSDKINAVFNDEVGKKPQIVKYKKYTFNTKERPKLGVVLQGETNTTGLVVLKSLPNSAASNLGLIANDKIISVDGKSTTTVTSLRGILAEHEIGDNITVQYERGGITFSKVAALQKVTPQHYVNKRENYYNNDYYETAEWKEKACEKLAAIQGKPFLGVYLSHAHQETDDGAAITSIITGTGAEAAVLLAKDKIVKIDDQVIRNTKEAISFIESKQPGDQITIRIRREDKLQMISATLGAWADSPSGKRKVEFLSKYCTEEEETIVEEIIEEVPVEEVTEVTEEAPAETPATKPLALEDAVTLDIFPNPTTDQVTIQFEGKKAPLSISVVSVDGKEMYTNTINNFDGVYNKQLQLEDYPSGIYFVNLRQGEEQYTQQIIVE